MSEAPSESVLDDTATAAEAARFRIAHLFLFTTLSAVILSLRMLMSSGIDDDEYALYNAVAQGIAAILHGAAVGGCLVLLRRRWQGELVRIEAPGHWWLLFFGCGVVWSVILSIAVFRVRSNLGEITETHSYYLWHGDYLARAIGLLLLSLVFWRCMEGRWWKAVLGVSALVLLFIAIISLLAYNNVWREWYWPAQLRAQIACALVALMLAVFGCLVDRQKRPGYDWLHWLGVLLVFLVGLAELTDSLYSYAFLP